MQMCGLRKHPEERPGQLSLDDRHWHFELTQLFAGHALAGHARGRWCADVQRNCSRIIQKHRFAAWESRSKFPSASYPPPRVRPCVRGAARARPWITRLTPDTFPSATTAVHSQRSTRIQTLLATVISHSAKCYPCPRTFLLPLSPTGHPIPLADCRPRPSLLFGRLRRVNEACCGGPSATDLDDRTPFFGNDEMVHIRRLGMEAPRRQSFQFRGIELVAVPHVPSA